MIYWWKIKLLLFIIKFLKISPEWPNLLRGPKWHWTCWYQVSLVPDSHFWPQTRVGHSEEILRKVSEGCSLMWKGERGVQNDPPYFRGPKWDCPWTLRVILNPFPLSAVSFGNFSEEFLTMTHPTLGVQNGIGPVGIKFPMALRVILDPPFLFLQWATAFRNFSEDFPRMTPKGAFICLNLPIGSQVLGRASSMSPDLYRWPHHWIEHEKLPQNEPSYAWIRTLVTKLWRGLLPC